MLGEESESADYWKRCGDLALQYGVKHIIIMVRERRGAEKLCNMPEAHDTLDREHTGQHSTTTYKCP